ncbi:MAG: hypothetical protein IBX69_10760, partial [Anaerolineales bacterium]|nr:hypothetical protein [Anaerolineales bacterium]
MGEINNTLKSIWKTIQKLFNNLGERFSDFPFLSWLIGILVSVVLENVLGNQFARLIGLPRAPVLFGFDIALQRP